MLRQPCVPFNSRNPNIIIQRIQNVTAFFQQQRNMNNSTRTPTSLMSTVQRMRSKLNRNGRPRDEERDSSAWESLWKEGLTPWDLRKPTPLLEHELLERRKRTFLPSTANVWRALVPGCGSGYDLLTLLKYHQALHEEHRELLHKTVVTGLDIAPSSLQRARAVVEEFIGGRANQAIRPVKAVLELKKADFFADPSLWETVYSTYSGVQESAISDAPQFDFIFDYTFFCALPPTMRHRWGEQTARLLHKKPHSRLLTIMFPIVEDAPMHGPPYPVTVQDYQAVLEPYGLEMECAPFASPLTVRSRAGKELVCYWSFRD